MREIKFRAWVESEKELVDVKNINFKENTVTLPIQTSIISDYWWNETSWDFQDIKLMQYTGLKDKNNKEIYFDVDYVKLKVWHGYESAYVDDFTHDVVDSKSSTLYEYEGVITRDEFGNPHLPNYYFANLLDADKFEFEILGDVYNNPELIGK